MYFTETKLRQLAAEMEETVSRYKSKYYDLKSAVDTSAEYEAIWAEGHIEPHCADYIFDLENADCARKIFKSEPKKKAFRSKHYYKDNEPVYSVVFDGYGEAAREKFFVRGENSLIGAAFSMPAGLFSKPAWLLIELSETIYDEKQRPVEYRCINRNKLSDPVIDCCVYFYEGEHIISAEVMRELNAAKKIMMYDNPLYDNWNSRNIDYRLSVSPMNPQFVRTYEFIYGESGFPTEFVRTGYSYNTVTTRQWKIGKRKVLSKGFSECGIPWFTK